MRGSNFRDLVKDEMVNRFENVVKNEINQYKLEKQESNIRFNKIEITLQDVCKTIFSLKQEISDLFEDVAKLFLEEKDNLASDFDEQRRFIRANTDAITSHIKESNAKIASCVQQNEFEHVFLEMQNKFRQLNVSSHKDKQDICKTLYDLKKTLESYICEEFKSFEESYNDFMKISEEQKVLISYLQSDNEAFVRELSVCKKKAFVQEKNIENLYTQIEKIKAGKV